jgi:hypothetical protein
MQMPKRSCFLDEKNFSIMLFGLTAESVSQFSGQAGGSDQRSSAVLDNIHRYA